MCENPYLFDCLDTEICFGSFSKSEEENKILHGDCLELMKDIPDKSIDMILCDLPYGTTICKWDTIIPFEKLWEQYTRIIKDNRAIVLTASQPFTSALVMSNIKMFRFSWIWKKNAGSNFAILKYQPMKEHEDVLVFIKEGHLYNPQMQKRSESGLERVKSGPMSFKRKMKNNDMYMNIGTNETIKKEVSDLRCPSSVQCFNRERGLHPTQKPVALFEYLIRTYTNEGDLVLDNCAGSGTTGIACMNTKRNFILMEKDDTYFEVIKKRIEEHRMKK